MRKKVFGFILTCIMMIGCFNINIVSAIGENMSEDMKGIVELLRTLEIVPDYYDYNVNVNDKVSRADFVAAAAKLINQTEYSGKPYYYDVPQTHWAYKEISALTELGIVNGHSDKLFTPDQTVTKIDAYKIIMTVLGYKTEAENNGGYPNGYMNAAIEADVTDGVSGNTEVTIGDMFIILYNALKAPVMKSTGNSIYSSYEVDENDTVLSIYKNIYYDEGVLAGTDGVTLDGEDLASDYVLINDELYQTRVEIDEYFGEEIEFFYELDKRNDEQRIIWARLTGETEVLNITANNDVAFDKTSYELTYYVSNKAKTIDLSRSIAVIYNGRVTNSNLSDIFNLPKYEAKFIEGDNNTYDIAIVNAYENYMVKALNENTLIAYDKLVSGRQLKLDENAYEKFSLNLLGSKEMTFVEIKANNILSVYKSADGKALRVSVSAETVSGVIESTQEDDYGVKLRVNAVEYYMPESAVASSPIKPAPGQNVTLYLDVKGEVAYSEISSSQFVPAYLIGIINDTDSDALRIKYINNSGAKAISECVEKLRIDGVTYQDTTKIYKRLVVDGEFKPQFALVKLNQDGEISAIDTEEKDSGGSDDLLSVNIPYQSGKLYKSDGLLNTYGVINNSTFIFSVPLDRDVEEAKDDEFGVISKSAISNDSYLNFVTYKTKEKVGYEQYMVVKGISGTKLSNSEMPILVDTISNVINDEGEVVECLKGWQGTARVSVNSDGEYLFSESGMEKGDVVRVYKNGSGKVTDSVMCFDYSEKSVSGAMPEFNAVYTTAVGYVNDVVDNVVRIGYATPETVDMTLFGTNVPTLIYNSDSEKPEIYKGTLDEARTYINEASDCSLIFVTQTRSAPRFFIIYN